MAKKLKDWYDGKYLEDMARKLQEVSDDFDHDRFLTLSRDKIEDLTFGQRQLLIARAIKESLPLSYRESLDVFYQLLGPELPDNEGNFTQGYRLWPIGKFVEEYGQADVAASVTFSKELTKRFTGEYCMRPLIEKNPDQVIPVIKEWSLNPNMRVRRLASECMRIYLPWGKKMTTALDFFDDYKEILSNLRHDQDKYVQKSVANNLNDLYKVSPDHFYQIIEAWEKEGLSDASRWIIKHGSRNINK